MITLPHDEQVYRAVIAAMRRTHPRYRLHRYAKGGRISVASMAFACFACVLAGAFAAGVWAALATLLALPLALTLADDVRGLILIRDALRSAA